MRTEVIEADTVDVAVEGIFNELNRGRQNVIYFDGWDGLGASAVLRAVAQRVAKKEPTRPPGLNFELVIHTDCSKWESTRAVQRAIAEQLKLPNQVMEMFDKQDEEDDFNGIIDQGSRAKIAEVEAEIQKGIQGRRFLLVLHNGSNEEVDISSLGLSVYWYLTNKVVWTFRGRFRIDPKMRDKVTKKNVTDVLLSAAKSYWRDQQEFLSYLLNEEATQVACKHDISPAIVVECVLYMLKLNCIRGHHVDTDYDLARHACNYWICDGIMQKITDSVAWQVGDALEGEIRLDMDYHCNDLPSHLQMYAKNIPHWASPAYGFVLVPAGVVPSGTFQHFDKLGVIKLSRCSFSFSSPPFRCCRSLRFLWLDHCQDLRSTDTEEREQDEDPTRSWSCFQSLWVLDLRYTDCNWILSAQMLDLMTQLRELNVMGAKNWDMSHLRGQLRNIRKLRVTKSTCYFKNNVFSEMESMELDFSGNTIGQGMISLSGPASNSSLKTVTIDGCVGLKVISFRGCKELKNMFLKGSVGSLEELDLSGTKVKTLDLGRVQSTFPKRIILLGCEELRAILWPESLKRPDVLRIGTTSAEAGEALRVHPHADRSLQQKKEEMFMDGWQISLMDARLLRSLSPVRGYLKYEAQLHIDIYSPAILGGSNFQGTSSDKLVQVQPRTSTVMDSEYSDVLKDGRVEDLMMWECPEIRRWWGAATTCIIKVVTQGQASNRLEDAPSPSTSALLLPDICEWTISLHVYDNSSITSIPEPPSGSEWEYLNWCRVERCPKLHTVFTLPRGSDVDSFKFLQTFWASELLSARYIWVRTYTNFYNLNFLHLDNCPRLVAALETIEIVYCGDLKEVFPLDPELQEQGRVIEFPWLSRIHLHELPTLQRICGCRMSAPKLKTIKIRGCWSLRRLPAVGHKTKPPKVDCEKEWWNNLEWDGLEKYHHPSLYEPSHSLHYKARLPRVSVLR